MPSPRERFIRRSSVIVTSSLFMITLVVASCSDPIPAAPAVMECAPGEVMLDNGACQGVGLPLDMPCPPGELVLEDGKTCQKAGVPASACEIGFAPDGKDGCEPILPADPCPKGQMAVPGDTVCHEVAPCGEGTWGDIPVEANTQFVDQAYAGGDSDGTQGKPWTAIQNGVNAAANGAIVAVAAGSYPEDVLIQGKPVRLWGRCPAMVEVAGAGLKLGAIQALKNGVSGTEIHSVAVTGPKLGIVVSGAKDVRIEGVWIHDAGNAGLDIEYTLGSSSAVIKGSLVEQNHNKGIAVFGSSVTIETSVVRSTLPDALGDNGLGISVEDFNARANVTVDTCLLEQNAKMGVLIGGSDAMIVATVVRETKPSALDEYGRGIVVADNPISNARANVTVRACFVERNHEVGVHVEGSDATIEATVVRSTLPNALGKHGRGINIQDNRDTQERANVTVRACLVEENHRVGLMVGGSNATIEATVIRGTLPDAQEKGGRGVNVQMNAETKERAAVTVSACVVEQNQEMGVFVAGADITIETTVVRSNAPDALGQNGRGIHVQGYPLTHEPSDAIIRGCLVEQNHDVGVYTVLSDTTIVGSIVRDTAPQKSDNLFGDGIDVSEGKVTMQNVEVTGNARAGVASFGGQVLITGAVITCNGIDLEGEPYKSAPFSFDGSTGWQCSAKAPAECTELGSCHVETTSIEAPTELPLVDSLPQ